MSRPVAWPADILHDSRKQGSPTNNTDMGPPKNNIRAILIPKKHIQQLRGMTLYQKKLVFCSVIVELALRMKKSHYQNLVLEFNITLPLHPSKYMEEA